MDFCTDCNNRLEMIEYENRVINECTFCKQKYELTTDILYNIPLDKGISFGIENVLNQITYQPAAIKLEKECPKCKTYLTFLFRTKKDEEIFHKCYCGNIFQ